MMVVKICITMLIYTDADDMQMLGLQLMIGKLSCSKVVCCLAQKVEYG